MIWLFQFLIQMFSLFKAQMAIICGICLPVKILLMEYSDNYDQIKNSIVGICWLFQMSQSFGFVILDICLLLVTIGRYLFVYKTSVALVIRHSFGGKVAIISAVLVLTVSRPLLRYLYCYNYEIVYIWFL